MWKRGTKIPDGAFDNIKYYHDGDYSVFEDCKVIDTIQTTVTRKELEALDIMRRKDMVYLSDSEAEMVKALRAEKDILVTEQNEKSSTQKAVEDIQRLEEYLSKEGINFSKDTVDNIIACNEHRLFIIKRQRSDLNKIRDVVDDYS